MRERTTWDRAVIAAFNQKKVAEDPRAMNQEHLSQQPAADKYDIGGPSEFGESVHPSAGTWKAEMSNGQTSRNEIGMPEMRKDTFNHPEKTAAMDDEAMLKKAQLCASIAEKMLSKKASTQAIEDQAYALMHLPDHMLVATSERLAQEEDEEEEEEKSEQQKQAAQNEEKGQQAQDEKKEQKNQEEKSAGQIPPQFLENVKKKQDEAADKKEDKKEQKEAAQSDLARAVAANDMQAVQSMVQSMVQQAMQQQLAQNQQQTQATQQQMGQQQNEQTMAQQNQQACSPMGQQQQQMGQQQQQAQQSPEDQMLDDLLKQEMQGQDPFQLTGAEIQIEATGNGMDMGGTQLSEQESATLGALFANSQELRNATEAYTLQHGQSPSAPAPMPRTASTRTVGTRPTEGVSTLGNGVVAGGSPSASDDVRKLSQLWNAPPDVSSTFRS